MKNKTLVKLATLTDKISTHINITWILHLTVRDIKPNSGNNIIGGYQVQTTVFK